MAFEAITRITGLRTKEVADLQKLHKLFSAVKTQGQIQQPQEISEVNRLVQETTLYASASAELAALSELKEPVTLAVDGGVLKGLMQRVTPDKYPSLRIPEECHETANWLRENL